MVCLSDISACVNATNPNILPDMALYSTKEVAEKLGIAKTTVFAMVKSNKILPINKQHKTWLFDSRDIDLFLNLYEKRNGMYQPKREMEVHNE